MISILLKSWAYFGTRDRTSRLSASVVRLILSSQMPRPVLHSVPWRPTARIAGSSGCTPQIAADAERSISPDTKHQAQSFVDVLLTDSAERSSRSSSLLASRWVRDGSWVSYGRSNPDGDGRRT